jgi:alpha-beta hydrolase superfamily lysophospholipase
MPKVEKKEKIIFIHGLESSGEGFKGNFLKKIIPDILTPSFEPYQSNLSITLLLKKRMQQLESLLKLDSLWIMIGSSFGGLMATLYALQNPNKVSKMILLAPALNERYFPKKQINAIAIPVIIFHGKFDNVVARGPTEVIARKYFSNLEYNIVDDDHYLRLTVQALDWKQLLGMC